MKIKYTKEHEWVSVVQDIAIIGITHYAQQQLGDIVFFEAPETGTNIKKGNEVGVVESVKAASEIYAPISGEIIEVNKELDSEPSLINTDPEKKGWMFKIKITDESEISRLMDEESYSAFVEASS
jgi:glycine cleavage system H protein